MELATLIVCTFNTVAIFVVMVATWTRETRQVVAQPAEPHRARPDTLGKAVEVKSLG